MLFGAEQYGLVNNITYPKWSSNIYRLRYDIFPNQMNFLLTMCGLYLRIASSKSVSYFISLIVTIIYKSCSSHYTMWMQTYINVYIYIHMCRFSEGLEYIYIIGPWPWRHTTQLSPGRQSRPRERRIRQDLFYF